MSKLAQGFSYLIAVIIVLFTALLAGMGWWVYTNNQPAVTPSPTNESTSLQATREGDSNMKQYIDRALGITFSYPKTWITLKCDGRDETLYLGSNEQSLGIHDGTSILCGGGTDFAPPGSFYLMPRGTTYEGTATAEEVTIGGQKAYKYFDVEDGNGLREEGFETTQYFIDRPNGVLVITYSEWPTGNEGRDTSSESKAAFTKLVESSLRF